MRVFAILVGLVAILALSTSGCSQEPDVHNAADVDYLQSIAATESGNARVALILTTTASNDQARDLGAAIQRSQLRYAERAKTILSGWSIAVPDPGIDQASQDLQTSASSTFDADALTLLRQRHDATVALSQAQLTTGQSEEAKKLARDLISARNAELGQIKALLRVVGG